MKWLTSKFVLAFFSTSRVLDTTQKKQYGYIVIKSLQEQYVLIKITHFLFFLGILSWDTRTNVVFLYEICRDLCITDDKLLYLLFLSKPQPEISLQVHEGTSSYCSESPLLSFFTHTLLGLLFHTPTFLLHHSLTHMQKHSH